MTIVLNKMFVNLFDDPRITPSRFLNFCMFAHDAMEADNENGRYDSELVVLTAIIGPIEKEINEVDTSLHTQVNNTSEVKRFVKGFGQFMMKNRGAISYALGGEETDAFLEFYPYDNQEYLLANRSTMPMLTGRVNTLATKYADQLGAKLSGELQAFFTDYKKVLTTQRKQIGSVNKNREERNTAYEDAQWEMTGVVHRISAMNLRNPAASQKLFPFHKLYPQSKERITYLKGELAAGQIMPLLNHMLSAGVEISIQNTSVNANIMIWLAMSPADAPPETGVVINANKRMIVMADKLGNLGGSFLMVKNLSDINKATYVIGIAGLKKDGEMEEGEVKKVELNIAS